MTVGTDDKTIVADGGAITLGDEYVDKLTGFSGKATSFIIVLEEPNQVLLENEMASRWLTMGRIAPLTDPVL